MNISAALLQPTKTEEILISMLREEKGYGRRYGVPHWVGNQKRDFCAEPRARVDFRWKEVNYRKNVFHHLNDHLEIDAKLSDQFHKFAFGDDWEDEPWLTCMHAFLDHLKATRDDYEFRWGDNTYNSENHLDQDIQYEYFLLDGEPFVLLHIHNGEDIRSGYTTPFFFSVIDECFFLFADGFIRCDSCGAYWMTDDGYHWYFEGTTGIVHEIVQLEDLVGDLVIDDDGNATCPRCDVGLLIC